MRPIPAPEPRDSSPSRSEQQHTARYQGGSTGIHYPFHPRTGQRVEVIRRHRFKGNMVYVVRQPDGTLAQPREENGPHGLIVAPS